MIRNLIDIMIGGFDNGRTPHVQQYDVESREYECRLWRAPGVPYQLREDALVGVVYRWRRNPGSKEYETKIENSSTVVVKIPKEAMALDGIVTMQLVLHEDGGVLCGPEIDFAVLRSIKASDTESDEPVPLLVALVGQTQEVLTQIRTALENGEFDGKDGSSPEVTLTQVDGGVRIDVVNEKTKYTETVHDGKDAVLPEKLVTEVNGKTGSVSLSAGDVGALPKDTSIPAKTSELNNDSGFITKAVTDLTNYYLKKETYSKDEIDQRISAIPKFAISVVSTLPTSGISETTIYLVGGGETGNLYTEYIYTNGAWEVLGSQRVDLTGYATETWVVGQLAGYQPKGDYALKSELPNADPSGTAASAVSAHNQSAEAHDDIRKSISQLSEAMGNKVTSPNVATVGQVIAVKAVDENGKPTEWEAVDMAAGGGSADAVLYTEQTLTDEQKNQARVNIDSLGIEDFTMLANGIGASQKGALKWDGVIGDRAYVKQADDVYYVHVSDETPSGEGVVVGVMVNLFGLSDGSGFASSFYGAIVPEGEDGLYLLGEGALSVPYDNFTIGEMTFPKKGIYFFAMNFIGMGQDISVGYISSLMIPGYTFAESGGGDVSKYFETSGGSDTLTWDGNTDGLVNSGDMYMVYSGVIPETLLSQEATVTMANGNTASATPEKIGDAPAYSLEIIVIVTETYEGLQPGVYFVKNDTNSTYATSLTIPGASFGGTEKLKEEYLPDGIGGSKPVMLYIPPLAIEGSSGKFMLYNSQDGATNETESDRVTAAQLRSILDKGSVLVYIADEGGIFLYPLYHGFQEKNGYTVGLIRSYLGDLVTAEYIAANAETTE